MSTATSATAKQSTCLSDDQQVRSMSAEMAESQDIKSISADADPVDLAARWLSDARKTLGDVVANSAALATTDASGLPNVRVMFLQQIEDAKTGEEEERGFVFFTSKDSPKMKEINDTKAAAMCLHWIPLGRQLRIRGTTSRVSDEKADSFFKAQCRETQISDWASDQSAPLKSTKDLTDARSKMEEKFKGQDIPRPDKWGGMRIIPLEIEFWVQKGGHISDRVLFKRSSAKDKWAKAELSP